MLGLQPVDCAGIVIVQSEIDSTELVRKVSLYELSLRIKLLYIKLLAGFRCLVLCPKGRDTACGVSTNIHT